MIINQENYRSFPAVSNSDLSWLEEYWEPPAIVMDKQKAYKFGNLIDAIITEQHRVNLLTCTVDNVQYDKADFDKAEKMKKAYNAHPFCKAITKHCSFQKISYNPSFKISYQGIDFELPAKCKWDLYCQIKKLPSGDIKSTFAKTLKQFEAACWHFDYFRSRAWYMDLEGNQHDVLIGISKENFEVFIIPICSIDYDINATAAQKKAYEYYRIGKEQYQEWAFKYWYLFGNIAA